MNDHVIEARIRFLTASEGGRQSGVFSGYRGQFHYGGDDYDGFQFFPDADPKGPIELGKEVRAFVLFHEDRWKYVHESKLHEGMTFEIREGARVVGRGSVTRIEVPRSEWDSAGWGSGPDEHK